MIFASFHLLLLSLLISSCHCAGLPEINEPVCVEEAGFPNWQHCNEIIANQIPPPTPWQDWKLHLQASGVRLRFEPACILSKEKLPHHREHVRWRPHHQRSMG